MRPRQRKDGLLVQKVDDELVVYDQERDHAHSLNRTCALVWGHCNGQKTAADITSLLQKELNHPMDEDVVWLALDRLEKAHLLNEPIKRQTSETNISRRKVMMKLGVAFLAPLVATIVAPTPAQAQSCIAPDFCLGRDPDLGCGGIPCCGGGVCTGQVLCQCA